MCSGCLVNNFASRAQCFKCLKRKPGTELVIPNGDGVVTAGTRECVVCLGAPPAVVFMPCKHLVTCAVCSPKIVDICPLCRSAIKERILPFM